MSQCGKKLLKEFAGIEPLQTFYQHLTDQIFQHHFPFTATDVPGSSEKGNVIGFEEVNSIRYVAGYVCRAVKTEEDHFLVNCLKARSLRELLENEVVDDSDDGNDESHAVSSSDWIKAIDRGVYCMRMSKPT